MSGRPRIEGLPDAVLDRIAAFGGPGLEADDAAGEAALLRWLGQGARARDEAESVLVRADLRGDEVEVGHALAVLAGLDCHGGDFDRGLARALDAIGRLERGGRLDAACAVRLDIAEAFLWRDGPSDLSAAARFLADARRALGSATVADETSARAGLRLLLAWARGATGDVEGALSEVGALRDIARAADGRELAWRIDGVAAVLEALRGAELHARRATERALETLEEMATALPREARTSFWLHPVRQAVRARASGAELRPSSPTAAAERPATFGLPVPDGRWARLLEITKRLAGEHVLERLLERITDSAVELSGAERGFVLRVGHDGKLVPAAVRDARSPDDPHVAFSQSIAEAVLIDGEPIVTTDARADGRLSEYVSVHNLMLQSVACIPIRDRTGILGVLYVEHRVRRGRFGEADVELLLAFADQAAIALANARVMTESEQRRLELEAANRDLEQARDEIERLLDARTAELDDARRELGKAREDLHRSGDRSGIVGSSEAIRRVLSIVDRVRDAAVSVVIQGESGTGKELFARAIHQGGVRGRKPFVALHCGAVPETLLESELFGHVRGAFTGADRDRVGVFAQANGGTLFLDEVADMPSKMQVELLRVLQDGKVRPVGAEAEIDVDVRVVCASNKSLRELVKQGLFREDLFYRLAVVELRLPPLRERPEDIPLLVRHILARHAEARGGVPLRLTREALLRLVRNPFPGNVRQLEHVLMNASVMVEGTLIAEGDLTLLGEPDDARPLDAEPAGHRGDGVTGVATPAGHAPRAVDARDEGLGPRSAGHDGDPHERAAGPDGRTDPGALATNVDAWKAQERAKILVALEATGWNRVKAAAQLGMPRRTFYRRLNDYGIL